MRTTVGGRIREGERKMEGEAAREREIERERVQRADNKRAERDRYRGCGEHGIKRVIIRSAS